MRLMQTGVDVNIELAITIAKSDGAIYRDLKQRYSDLIVAVYGLNTASDKYFDRFLKELFLIGEMQPDGLNKRFKGLIDVICDLSQLSSLCLYLHYLEELPEDIGYRLPNLESLNLEGNWLKKLPESIAQIEGLERVYIDNNPLLDAPLHIPSGCTIYADKKQIEKFGDIWRANNIKFDRLPF